jgi:hypothetical protein
MSPKKTAPITTSPGRKVCPVCGQVSYSPAGVHPQCAETQADEQRMKQAKAKKNAKPVSLAATPSAWRKPCPKCGTQVHVRKAQCACGHKFVVQKTKSGIGNGD